MIRATADEKDALLRPALRRRPGHRRPRGGDAGRRGRRRHPPGAHRPQLRLPGAQGDPQGRRLGAAVAPRAAARHRPLGGARGEGRPGHHQDPHRHRRRPRHLPRRRPDRRRTRAPPRSRCTGAPPTSSTAAPPTGRRSPGWSRPSTSRCSATATSGRPTTRCAWSPRPGAPASSSAAAAWAGRGCSATWPPPSRASRGARCPRFREVAAIMHRHATLLAEPSTASGTAARDFRKHVAWYLKGFSVGSDTRRALAMVSGLDELADLLAAHPRPAVPGRRPGCPARPHQPAAAGGAARGLAGRPGRPPSARGRRAAR